MRPYDTSWTGTKDVKLRNYTNIYVANNTDDPVGDTIKLGYVSSIDDIRMAADQYTFFHFPLSATSGSNFYDHIKNTSLINDGATYGLCPYKSDRIYKLKSEYQDTTPYGLAQPKALNNGKWLCTWLSGNVLDPDANPKWVDRWFDPGNVTEDEALRISGGASVYDIDSQMSLDYGAYYKYFRVGNKTVDEIDDSVSLGGSRLPLRINDWKAASASEIYTYLNVGPNTLFNDRVSNDFNDDDYAISFNGKNQAATVFLEEKTGFRTDSKYTIAFWAKVPDWGNATSYAFVDNMHFGGWRFGVINHAMDPYLFLHGNDSSTEILDGTVCVVNANGELLSTKAFWKTDPDMHHVRDTLYDIDGYFFVLLTNDAGTASMICKLDSAGNRLAEVKLNAGLDYLDLSNEGHGFVLYAYRATEDDVVVYKIDRYTMRATLLHDTGKTVLFDCDEISKGNFLSNYQVTNFYNIGVLKIYDDYFVYDKTVGWISDNGDKTEDGEWLDRKQNLKFHRFVEKGLISVICDYNNDAWGLESDKIVKYSVIHANYQKVQEFPVRFGDGDGVLDMIEVNQNGTNRDLLVVVNYDKKAIVFYDTDGSYVNSVDVAKYFVHPGDIRRITSYEWFRRNKKFTKCVFFDIMDSVTHRIIPVEADSLSNNDWHHFAAVVDGDAAKGKYQANFYIDCRLVGSAELTAATKSKKISTYYKYDSGIVLGGMVGKSGPIFSEMNVTGGAMSCSVDDFRVYNCPMKQEDLYYMMLTKYSCVDLIWHFKSQERNFVEEIEKFYKFKAPGSKSAHYVLHVKGYEFPRTATEEDKSQIKALLEAQMREAFKRIAPAYTDLLKIVWEN